MQEALTLTRSQKKAADRLDFFWRIKRGGTGRLGSTETRPVPLLVGPSGAGKTASVRDFATRHGLPIFSISAATWIIRGARNEGYTADALAAWIGEHSEGGIIFIDEVNKLRAEHLDASWGMGILNELISIMDQDARLLRMGFKQEQIDALDKFILIGAGAWQETWIDSRARATSGFGGTQAARDAVILKALGIDAATLAADIKAGKTLAQIDPTNTAALISALVAFESANIDAAVTAKQITAAQATTLKAGLTAQVTAEVNSLRGPGRGHDGGRNGGPIGGTGKKLAPKTGATPTPSIHA